MVDLAATQDDWDADDETGYDNPHDYDPNAEDDSNDPTVEGEDPNAAEEDAVPEQIEPMYANVFDWVEGFFTQVIRRKINPTAGDGLSWDGRWWLYPEVFGRLTALHYAWEEARVSDKPSAMSAWWIHHLEPHVRVILDGETGPMSNAAPDATWAGWPALETQPVPADLLAVLLPDN